MRIRAVCVGINAYPTAPLQNCVADSNLMSALIQAFPLAALAGAELEIAMLQDADATKANILAALQAMQQAMGPGDVMFFTYSGHGTQIRDINGDEPDKLDEAICPVNFTWEDPRGTGITDDDLAGVFASVPQGTNITIILDSCHSGKMLRNHPVLGAVRSMPMAASYRNMAHHIQAMRGWRSYLAMSPPLRQLGKRLRRTGILLSACRANEVAYDGVGNGPHSRAVDQVLRSMMFRCTYQELKRQVRSRVLPRYAQHATLEGRRRFKKQFFGYPW